MARNSHFPTFCRGFCTGLCILLLSGCADDVPSDPGGGDVPELSEWDGRREFIGHLPLSYDHERRVPLLIAYHGSGITAELMRQTTGLDWIANDHGFAVIYPDASDGFFPIPCPGCANEGRDGFEEIDFAREIVRWTSEKYALHPDSVYATGFSMGGFFVNYMGCAPNSPVRGIAPVAAGAREDFDGFCASPRPKVLIIHAIQDLVAPIDGRDGWMSIAELADLWRSHDGCAATATEWDYSAGATGLPTVHASRWDGCAGKGPVRLDVIDGAGHRWLTEADIPNGLDLGEVIADYFFPMAP